MGPARFGLGRIEPAVPPVSGKDVALRVGPRTVTVTVLGPEEGRAALFFHGAPGCRLQVLRLEQAANARRVRIIGIDRPGCGRTSPARGDLARQMVDDVEAVLDAFELETSPAIAVSGGVAALLTTASVHVNRIERVLIGSGLGLLTTRDHLAGASASSKAVSVLARRGAHGARLALALPYLAARLAPPRNAQVGGDERLGALMGEMRETFLQGTRGPARDLSMATRAEVVDLSAVHQPVIAWHGSRDRHAPLPAMRALIERLPNATLQVVEDADHFVFESQANLIMARVGS